MLRPLSYNSQITEQAKRINLYHQANRQRVLQIVNQKTIKDALALAEAWAEDTIVLAKLHYHVAQTTNQILNNRSMIVVHIKNAQVAEIEGDFNNLFSAVFKYAKEFENE